MRQVLTFLTALTALLPLFEVAAFGTAHPTPIAQHPSAMCIRAPRTVDELIAIAGPRQTPVIIDDFGNLPDSLPTGTPVDPDTAAEIRVMLGEFAACILSGELLRSYAYFSERFIQDAGPLDEGYLASLAATPTPEPDQTFYSIDDVSQVERLRDGRVGAVVTAGGGCERSQPEPTCTFYAIFVQDQHGWVIDEQIRDILGPDGVLTVSEYLELPGTPVSTPTV